MPRDDDDAPPPAQDARRAPKRQTHLLAGTSKKKSQRMDPRFDPLFGKANEHHFQQHYKFVQEQQEEEEERRRFRIKCLKCMIRRIEIEEAEKDTTEYDLSDYEQEVFGPEHQGELRELKLTHPKHVYAELARLQNESQIHVSRTKDRAIRERRGDVKKKVMQKELKAIRDGAKSKPYFPKRAEMKKAVLADTFERINSSGGKGAVERYLSQKSKRK